MVWDTTGLLLFLLWLLLPPLYVVALGRAYVRRCSKTLQRTATIRDELLDLFDDLELVRESAEPPEDLPSVIPTARDDDTQDFIALVPAAGRHRLDPSPVRR